jgi:hypothetical protein
VERRLHKPSPGLSFWEWPFPFFTKAIFPGMVLGYWLTNFAGFLLMHKGVEGMIQKKKWGIRKSLLVSLIYTGIIFLLYRLKIIRPPF